MVIVALVVLHGVRYRELALPTCTLGDMAHIAGGLPALSVPQVPWKP